ncbi:DUF3048 domain-containing protein [Anaerolentibacter hominis]|uniref:DUF3048 domain-containing protein n=1 Tax=Anaerolentibacter hominis TaxID=3079009 RepID=UPI0031B872D8
MKKFGYIVLVCIMMAGLLSGCKKKEEPPVQDQVQVPEPEPTPTPVPEPEPVPEEPKLPEGMVYSQLTGEPVKEELAKKRPYAIVFNNISYANPQSGTSQASILYEALAEGGITRMLGIYEDIGGLERIGSIRSARHYFVSFADEYDAIFVHYGHTKYATAKISDLKVNNLSGLSGIGTTVFYRDNSIKAPHNAFASEKGILAGTEKLKYRTDRKEDWENHFSFHEEDTELTGGKKAEKVTLGFSSYTSPYFTYDSENKVYQRFQFKKAHVDANTGKQLTFKNIIIQLVKEWNIDKNGYQTMDLENSKGKGYYITDGKYVPITWQKNESTKKMNYYDESGERLTINPGKTFIAVYPNNRTEQLKMEGASEK